MAIWILLPLLALPIARRLMAMVSEDALIRHVGWFPSGREARLLWLTLAAVLAWPYRAVEQTCAVGLIGNLPGYVVLGIAALAAVLTVTIVVRPASEKES